LLYRPALATTTQSAYNTAPAVTAQPAYKTAPAATEQPVYKTTPAVITQLPYKKIVIIAKVYINKQKYNRFTSFDYKLIIFYDIYK
jgi:hypothetical protein